MIFAYWLYWLASFLILAGMLSIAVAASEWWKWRKGKLPSDD